MSLLQSIFTIDEMQCCLITAILFMAPLRKRNDFKKRFVLSLIAWIIAIPLVDIYHNFSMILDFNAVTTHFDIVDEISFLFFSALSQILPLLIMSGFILYCCDIRPSHAFYGAVCAYITQNLAYTLFLVIMPRAAHRGMQATVPSAVPVEILISAFIYWLSWKHIASALPFHGDYQFDCRGISAELALITWADRLIGSYISALYDEHFGYSFVFIMLYDFLVFSALLSSQRLGSKNELYKSLAESEHQLRQQKETEYIAFRANIDSLNRKYHDLKHLLQALRFEKMPERKNTLYEELEHELETYDSHTHTGNDALDALLTQTWARCRENEIRWTCMADGKALAFMDPVDLYVLLGNALDNAIENTVREDPQNRNLNVSIWSKGNMAFIRIENTFMCEISYSNGLPKTTKEDSSSHGYGMKNMKAIVDSYKGEMSAYAKGSVFVLTVMLPMQQ